MARLSSLGHLGIAWEATAGVAVVPTTYIPYETLKSSDEIKKQTDEARRAVLSKDFAVYNTTREGKVELDCDAYVDAVGYFFKAILGTYAVTGSAVPYTHSFKVLNDLPKTMTLSDYDALSERQYSMGVLNELGFKFDTESIMKMSAKFVTKASTVVSQSTPTYSNAKPFLGYQLIGKVNGTQNVNLVGGEVNIKREGTKMLFTANNTQDPTKFATGRISVEGKLMFDVEDETELNYYLQGSQLQLDLLFTQDANTSLDFNFGLVDVTKADVDRSQEFIRVNLDFKALFNATNAGNIAVTLKNSVATY